MIKRIYIRGILTAFTIYAVFFIITILSVMTDSAIPAFGRIMHFVLKYICGFPLVLLGSDFPFFLESRTFMWISIPLTLVNAILQVCIVLKLRRRF